MGSSAPYREPGCGWGRSSGGGGCFQHWRRSASVLPVMQNITQVANWLCPDSTDHPSGPGPWPATITPQPLINSQSETQCNDSDVSPGNPAYCAEGHPRHEKPVCGEEFGAYSERDFWSRLLDPTTQVKVDLNLYQPLPGVEVSLAPEGGVQGGAGAGGVAWTAGV